VTLHLAFHYLGCARSLRDGLAVPGRVGPLIETLSEVADQVTVLAYDPPDDPTPVEDATEYTVHAPAGNVQMLSLGPKGSLRDHPARRARVHRIVRAASSEWDVLALQIANRRAGLVFDASKCDRTVALVVGRSRDAVTRSSWTPLRKAAGLLRTRLEDVVDARIIDRSGFVLTNSNELKDAHGASSKITVAPMSTRRAAFEHRADDRLAGTMELAVSGRIVAEKGVFEALDAFAALRSQFPYARLHVIGDGPARGEVMERARRLGVDEGLVSHGWVPVGPALFGLYASMDALLLPSYAEGLPYAVWEALAHSVLVVCTPVGGLRTAFEHEREVVFVPPGSVDAIVQAIRKLCAEPELRKSLIREGFERARGVTAESVASQIADGIATTWGLKRSTEARPGQR
jgi:glycosyltransferase involved in cell wall biosynthesis